MTQFFFNNLTILDATSLNFVKYISVFWYNKNKRFNNLMLKQNSISLSFDVEDLYCIRNRKSNEKDFSSHHEGGFDCITEPTLKILELLEKKNISATFFVVSDILDRYPTLSKHLKQSRHEIGCHSSSHDVPKVNESAQNIKEWEKDIYNAKSKLSNFFNKNNWL